MTREEYQAQLNEIYAEIQLLDLLPKRENVAKLEKIFGLLEYLFQNGGYAEAGRRAWEDAGKEIGATGTEEEIEGQIRIEDVKIAAAPEEEAGKEAGPDV